MKHWTFSTRQNSTLEYGWMKTSKKWLILFKSHKFWTPNRETREMSCLRSWESLMMSWNMLVKEWASQLLNLQRTRSQRSRRTRPSKRQLLLLSLTSNQDLARRKSMSTCRKSQMLMSWFLTLSLRTRRNQRKNNLKFQTLISKTTKTLRTFATTTTIKKNLPKKMISQILIRKN